MLVRPATPADHQDIVDIDMRARFVAYSDFMPMEYLASLRSLVTERWTTRLSGNEPNMSVLVSQLDHGPIVTGFTRFGASRSEPASSGAGQLEYLYVDPRYWGMGVGRLLLEAAERGLTGMGFTAALLSVYEPNERAITLYERNGWRFDGTAWSVDRGGVPVRQLQYRKELQPSSAVQQARRN